ncbi:helix-turn-helix domain-containing protein [Streptomyces sp. NPDC041068]|uniref:helix-turn-helix domain-containing protein n=1 Tax=Streptomyces sp. NPDC041068 TaxID=3155130 RepID=UPI0033F331F6
MATTTETAEPLEHATTALRRQLGGFLRAYRESLSPGDVGLPNTTRRRTKGLRREEVAALSGVSVSWYTWLEQGRVDTSRQVLAAVARALRLDDTAHRHALALAGFAPATEGRDTSYDPNLRAMLDSWPDSPALLLGPALDILAWNSAYTALLPDPADTPEERRNLVLLLVGDARHQQALPGWEPVAIDLYRHLRTRADRRPGDEGFRRLTEQLRSARPDLDAWWACRSIGDFASRTVEIVETASQSGRGRGRAPRPYAMNLLLTPQPQDAAVLVLTPRPYEDEADGSTVA